MNGLHELTKAWLEKAEHDLGTAKIIFLHLPDYHDTIAFHCQQAVEKYIKAILVYRQIAFQRSHDLIYLLDLLSSVTVINNEQYKKAAFINGFGVQFRYPNKIVMLSSDDIQHAIDISNEFRKFAHNQTGIPVFDDVN